MQHHSLHVAALLGLTLTGAVQASGVGDKDDRFWLCDDGDFEEPLCWSDGDSLGAPGADDTAIFDLAGFVTNIVSFKQYHQTDRLIVRAGRFFFYFNEQSYTLLNPTVSTPGIVVGDSTTELAELTIYGGLLEGAYLDLGRDGGTGWMHIDGADTALQVAEGIQVGVDGNGFLEVEDGQATAHRVVIGTGFAAAGQAVVSGSGAQVLVTDRLVVGQAGFGHLQIDDGATVVCASAAIAQQEASYGSVDVAGDATQWIIDGILDVGMNNLGVLRINDGAMVSNTTFATIGTFAHGGYGSEPFIGEVYIEDPGSTWLVDGDLYHSAFGQGFLWLRGGGRLVVTGDLFDGRGGISSPATTTFQLTDSDDYPTPAMAVDGYFDRHAMVVELREQFVPEVGDWFALASAASGLGPPALTLPRLPGDRTWVTHHSADALDLQVTIQGDADGNGVVDVEDLLLVIINWGDCRGRTTGCTGDLDTSGDVDADDLVLVFLNWGA